MTDESLFSSFQNSLNRNRTILALWGSKPMILLGLQALTMVCVTSIPSPVWVLSRFICLWLFATLWTVVCQVPLSMGFSRQEYCSGLPFPPTWDLPEPGIELLSLMSPALAGGFFTSSTTWEALTGKVKQLDEEIPKALPCWSVTILPLGRQQILSWCVHHGNHDQWA